MPYLVSVLIGCRWVLGIRCCARFTSSGVSDYLRHIPPIESSISSISPISPRPEAPDGPAVGYYQPTSPQLDEERTAFMLAPEGNLNDARLYDDFDPVHAWYSHACLVLPVHARGVLPTAVQARTIARQGHR